jgi:GT2 family glycosyltransferase
VTSRESVVAVTVTYGDRLGFVERQARALLAQGGLAERIVVANGSDAALAARHSLGAAVIALPRNVGSASAFAAGIEAALAKGAQSIWLLDDDNLPGAAALDALLAARDTLAAGGLDPSLLCLCAWREFIEHRERRPSSFLGFHVLDLPGRLLHLPSPRPAPSLPIELPTAAYGGLLLPRALLTRAGLPDPRFVLYADDTEYTDRLRRAGGRIFLVPQARVEDLAPRWQAPGRLLASWLDEADNFRAYYGARNEAWFDSHRLCGNRFVYRMNRAIYLAALRLLSRTPARKARAALLAEAIHAGEADALGEDPRFPLTAPRPA